MLRRWLKRGCWVLVLVGLVVIPARLAQGPASAVGSDEGSGGGAAAPFQRFSPAAWVIVVGVIGGLSAVAVLRRGLGRRG